MPPDIVGFLQVTENPREPSGFPAILARNVLWGCYCRVSLFFPKLVWLNITVPLSLSLNHHCYPHNCFVRKANSHYFTETLSDIDILRTFNSEDNNVISYDNELVLYVAPCNTSYSSFKVMFLCCFRRLENSIIIISLTPFGIIASGHSYHLTWCSSWKASLCPILNDSRQQLCTVHSNRGFYSCLVLYSFPFHHISKHKYPLYSFNSVCYQSYPVMK